MTHKILCKYSEFVLAPINALAVGLNGEYETIDGVQCIARPHTTWNNEDGAYDGVLDEHCQRFFGCPFSTIRSIWVARLGSVNPYWHLVRMERK